VAKAKQKSADEILAEKSDVKDIEDGKFRKQFVFQVLGSDEKTVLEDERMNLGNGQSTVQNALIRGVHPKDQPYVESVEKVHEGLNSASYKVTWAVKAIPSVLDLDPETTITPRDVRTEDDRRADIKAARERAAATGGFAE
jgi:hypothetical protein